MYCNIPFFHFFSYNNKEKNRIIVFRFSLSHCFKIERVFLIYFLPIFSNCRHLCSHFAVHLPKCIWRKSKEYIYLSLYEMYRVTKPCRISYNIDFIPSCLKCVLRRSVPMHKLSTMYVIWNSHLFPVNACRQLLRRIR